MSPERNSSVTQKIDAVKNASASSDIVKEYFSSWLSDRYSKKYPLAIYLACIEKVSVFLIRRKISSVDLWKLTDIIPFKTAYNKAINDKIFKATDRKTRTIFIHVGQAYLKFLKSKPFTYKAGSCPTIKAAVIHVLENEKYGMTVEQICNKIVADRLYFFGAQKPQNVIRIEIDRACENSNYAIHASKNHFKFEKNHNGEKVYFLLSATPTTETAQPIIAVNRKSNRTRQEKSKPIIIEIWSASIKRCFQTWMESENYAPATTRNYCSFVNRTVKYFKPLADIAGSEFSTTREAVRKFIALLRQNGEFNTANTTVHNQLSAALEAFARFIGSDTSTDKTAAIFLSKASQNADFISMTVKVLSDHFPNGFRLDSPIELLRFHRFTREDFGEKIALLDEELKQYISICGIYFDGKVYIVSPETKERIKNEIDYAFNEGMKIIFYEAFYQKHEDWLFPASVISFEMLKCVLLNFYPNFKHRGNYFTNNSDGDTEIIKIKDELVRVWGEDILLDYERLAKRLPYIPFEKIKYVLAYNGDFIWNSEEVYTHINMIQISKEERSQIMEFVLKGCRAEGFVSLSEIPLCEIEERNYKLTSVAIYNAVFHVCLEENFDRKGKIITCKGDKLDALEIMKNYCRIVDKCSLDDLFNYEKELTGEIHRLIPMEAGYAILVRTGKDTYVSEKYVNFNIEMIDNAIALFITDDYLPLKSFTTFAAFPHCGQAWNLFLLESYCRRFSERFRFEVLAVNSKNAGIVVRKSCHLSYAEIMVDAVAKSGIVPKKEVVEDFLCSHGYTGRRSYAKVNELIEQAKVMRERMD